MIIDNVAVADWFHKPEIVEIDSTGWDGGIGQQILVQAVDDVQVMRVMVLIGDGNGTILEQGVAEKTDELWWTYTTTTQVNGTRRVRAIAYDFPGHTTQSAWQN